MLRVRQQKRKSGTTMETGFHYTERAGESSVRIPLLI